jgi:hypothetical protein
VRGFSLTSCEWGFVLLYYFVQLDNFTELDQEHISATFTLILKCVFIEWLIVWSIIFSIIAVKICPSLLSEDKRDSEVDTIYHW